MPAPALTYGQYWFNELTFGGAADDMPIKVVTVAGLNPPPARVASIPNPITGGAWTYANNSEERLITITGHIVASNQTTLDQFLDVMAAAFELDDVDKEFHFIKSGLQKFVNAKRTRFDYDDDLEKTQSQYARYAIQLIAGDPTMYLADV